MSIYLGGMRGAWRYAISDVEDCFPEHPLVERFSKIAAFGSTLKKFQSIPACSG
jgi:hypothetical protein